MGLENLELTNPFSGYQTHVKAEWIDVNNHMNARFYSEVIYFAHELFTQVLGLGDDYVAAENRSKVVVESHILYEREIMAGTRLGVTTWLIAIDDKRLHFAHALNNLDDGYRAAFSEQLDLHVDLNTRRVTPFSDQLRAHLNSITAMLPMSERPQPLGRLSRNIG